jgi:UDP-N-acetylmuramyl pentapeptide phosphotransferase/UDP-N-acetylglucosamine-1-phosphate transferase
MISAIFLTVVMILVILAIPIILWYLFRVKKLHLPENQRNHHEDTSQVKDKL